MLKIVFFGTPELAVGVLEALVEQHEVLAVVTMPDKPRERGGQLTMTPVKKRAIELGLTVYEPVNPKEENFVATMERLKPDLFVVFAYGHILRKNLLDIPRLGPINVHTSILPYYRGAAPIERAILAGDRESGVSIMKMDVGMDTGPVCAVKRVTITDEMDAIELRNALVKAAVPLLMESLVAIEANTAVFVEQNREKATVAPKIQKEELLLTVTDKKGMALKVRGLTTYGAVKVQLESGDFLKIWKARPVDHFIQKMITVESGRLYLQATDGALELLEVQLEGKKRVGSKEFINGYKERFSL